MRPYDTIGVVANSRSGDRANFILGAIVFALALGLRLGYAATFPPETVVEAVDARGYHQIAVNLLEGHGFSLQAGPPYRPDSVRTPLYPAFVALVYTAAGPRPEAAVPVQAALDALTALLVGVVVARLAGTRRGVVAAAAYAVMPGQIRMANALMTETVLAFCLALATLLFTGIAAGGAARARPAGRRLALAAGCGLMLGLAVLCKPNVVALPAVYALGAAWAARAAGRRAAIRAGALVLSGALLVMVPWVARNWLVFGRPMLSTAFQDNLARVTAPATLAAARDEEVAPWTPRWEALYGEIVARAAARYGWPEGDPDQLDAMTYEMRQSQIAAVALEVVLAHPQAALASHLAGFVRSWAPIEYQFWYEYLSGEPWSSISVTPDAVGQALALVRRGEPGAALALLAEARWNQLPVLARALWYGWGLAYIVAGILAAAGIVALARRRPALAFVLVATILVVNWLPGPIAHVRFRIPVVPLLVMLAANAGAGEHPPSATVPQKPIAD